MNRDSLGILLLTPPAHPATTLALRTAQDAVDQLHSVHLFCLHDGIRCVDDPSLQNLHARGLHLTACAFAAEQRHIPISNRAVFGGLLLLANLLARTSRFLAFSPSSTCLQAPCIAHASRQTQTAPGPPRTISIRLHANPTSHDLSAEGCRVAAGLAIHPDLRIILECPAGMAHTLSDSPEPLIQQHLNLLRSSGGLVREISPPDAELSFTTLDF